MKGVLGKQTSVDTSALFLVPSFSLEKCLSAISQRPAVAFYFGSPHEEEARKAELCPPLP